MDIKQAHNLFLNYVRNNMNGKGGYYTGWIKINGDRICNNCHKHKRKALYIHLKEGLRPFLKCFRISCDIKRYITKQDFLDFGFDNVEAIKVLIEDTQSYNIKQERDLEASTPLIINDYKLSDTQIIYFEDRTNLYPDSHIINQYRIIPDLAAAIKDTYEYDIETSNKFKETKIQSNKHNITFATANYKMYFYRDVFDNKQKLKFSTGTSEPYTLSIGENPPEWLVVAEGVFDIINIHSKYAIIEDALYVATGGAQAIFNEICNLYTQNIESMKNLIIFADSDIKLGSNKYAYDKKFYNTLFKNLEKTLGKNAFKNIYLVYNKASKDFGDMREKILPEKIQIKGEII